MFLLFVINSISVFKMKEPSLINSEGCTLCGLNVADNSYDNNKYSIIYSIIRCSSESYATFLKIIVVSVCFVILFRTTS